jgi:hypothetical protein
MRSGLMLNDRSHLVIAPPTQGRVVAGIPPQPDLRLARSQGRGEAQVDQALQSGGWREAGCYREPHEATWQRAGNVHFTSHGVLHIRNQ